MAWTALCVLPVPSHRTPRLIFMHSKILDDEDIQADYEVYDTWANMCRCAYPASYNHTGLQFSRICSVQWKTKDPNVIHLLLLTDATRMSNVFRHSGIYSLYPFPPEIPNTRNTSHFR